MCAISLPKVDLYRNYACSKFRNTDFWSLMNIGGSGVKSYDHKTLPKHAVLNLSHKAIRMYR